MVCGGSVKNDPSIHIGGDALLVPAGFTVAPVGDRPD